jgi:predicted DNA-binding transcriptional regulator YafY
MTGRNVALERFQIVVGALLQRNKLFINYHGRGNDESSQREISPRRVTNYRDNRYLDAWCHSRNALRIPYSDPRQLVMDTLKHGAEVEVIAPEELRREVAECLRQGSAKYTARKMKT